jgi:hypothetical protein
MTTTTGPHAKYFAGRGKVVGNILALGKVNLIIEPVFKQQIARPIGLYQTAIISSELAGRGIGSELRRLSRAGTLGNDAKGDGEDRG